MSKPATQSITAAPSTTGAQLVLREWPPRPPAGANINGPAQPKCDNAVNRLHNCSRTEQQHRQRRRQRNRVPRRNRSVPPTNPAAGHGEPTTLPRAERAGWKMPQEAFADWPRPTVRSARRLKAIARCGRWPMHTKMPSKSSHETARAAWPARWPTRPWPRPTGQTQRKQRVAEAYQFQQADEHTVIAILRSHARVGTQWSDAPRPPPRYKSRNSSLSARSDAEASQAVCPHAEPWETRWPLLSDSRHPFPDPGPLILAPGS